MKQKQNSASSTVAAVMITVVLVVQVLLVLYPLAFTVSASFSESNSLASTSIVPFAQKFSLFQYIRLFTQTNYFHWYLNTLIIATANTVITVTVCSLCGYVFSRFMFPLKKPVMASMIILQMFPSFIGMIATYVILWKLNALNTLWGLILVYATGSIPFNSWLMKGYFDTVPRDIAEAAYIDGATPFGAFIRVVVPAAKPWMDFIFPRLVLRADDKKTLAVGLFDMINGRSADHFTMFAAGALLVAVPFTILFILGQKALLQSLAATGGKE